MTTSPDEPTAPLNDVDKVHTRPVITPPRSATKKARQAAADELRRLGYTEDGAAAMAAAVTEPRALARRLKGLEGTGDLYHAADRIVYLESPAGDGGMSLLLINSDLWAARVHQHMANPRDVITAGRPVLGDPRIEEYDSKSGLEVEYLAADPDDVIDRIIANHEDRASGNRYRDSMRDTGVHQRVTVIASRVQHRDGSTDAHGVMLLEGNTRGAAAREGWASHFNDITSGPAAPLYHDVDDFDRQFARNIGVLRQFGLPDGEQPDDEGLATASRLAVIPGEIVVGILMDDPSATVPSIHRVMRMFTSSEHIAPKDSWKPAANWANIANGVFDDLHEAALINDLTRKAAQGLLTPDEIAAEDGVYDLVDERACASISHLFDQRFRSLTRRSIRNALRKGRTTAEDRERAAAALAYNSVPIDPASRGSIMSTFERGVGVFDPHGANLRWRITGRDPDDILASALRPWTTPTPIDPVEDAGTDGADTRPPSQHDLDASLADRYELGLLGLWWLARNGQLRRAQTRVDSREPGQIIKALIEDERGLKLLHEAIVRGRADKFARKLGEDGSKITDANGQAESVTDEWLRSQYAPSKVSAPKERSSGREIWAAVIKAVDDAHRDVVRLSKERVATSSQQYLTSGRVPIEEAEAALKKIDDLRYHVDTGLRASRQKVDDSLDGEGFDGSVSGADD